jgi:hypothetical protein
LGAGGWQPEGWYRHNGKTCKPVATSWGVLLGIAEVLLGTAEVLPRHCCTATGKRLLIFSAASLAYLFAATSLLLVLSRNVCR